MNMTQSLNRLANVECVNDRRHTPDTTDCTCLLTKVRPCHELDLCNNAFSTSALNTLQLLDAAGWSAVWESIAVVDT